MKQSAAWVVALALTILLALPARAHTVSLSLVIGLQENQASIRLLDPYQVPAEGAAVEVAAVGPGRKASPPGKLAEGPAGVYRGEVTPPGAEAYELHVLATLGPDKFEVTLPVQPGEQIAERQVAMVPIEPEPGFPWGPVIYGTALVVLAGGTVTALLRKRRITDEGEI